MEQQSCMCPGSLLKHRKWNCQTPPYIAEPLMGDFQKMQALVSGRFDRARVQMLMSCATEAPMAPCAEEAAICESMPVPKVAPIFVAPQWAKVLCNNRDACRGCELMAVSDDENLEPSVYVFLYAKQGPHMSTVLPLIPGAVPIQRLAALSCVEALGEERYVYDVLHNRLCDCHEYEVPSDVEGDQLSVLQCLHFLRGCRVGADIKRLLWALFIVGRLSASAKSCKNRRRRLQSSTPN